MKELKEAEAELGRNFVIDKNRRANAQHEMIYQELIRRARDLSLEDLLLLSCDYIAYYHEAVLHNEDRVTIEVEAAKVVGVQSGWEEGTSYERIRSERFNTEAALLPTCQGDYRGVKGWFNEKAQTYSEKRAIFSYISSTLPEIGLPYSVPPPAWMLD